MTEQIYTDDIQRILSGEPVGPERLCEILSDPTARQELTRARLAAELIEPLELAEQRMPFSIEQLADYLEGKPCDSQMRQTVQQFLDEVAPGVGEMAGLHSSNLTTIVDSASESDTRVDTLEEDPTETPAEDPSETQIDLRPEDE